MRKLEVEFSEPEYALLESTAAAMGMPVPSVVRIAASEWLTDQEQPERPEPSRPDRTLVRPDAPKGSMRISEL